MSGALRQFSARKPVAAPPGGFAPSDVADLRTWYDADAITGLADGDGVLTWPDSHTGGHTMTAVSADNPPTYHTNVLNGKPVVRFGGSPHALGESSSSSFEQPNTIFIVFRNSSLAATRQFVFDGDGFNRHMLATNSSGDVRMYAGSWFTIATADTSWHYWRLAYNLGASAADRDGVSIATGGDVSDRLTGGGQRLGRSEANADYFVGDVAELFTYTRDLTSSEVDDIHAYLAAKYAV